MLKRPAFLAGLAAFVLAGLCLAAVFRLLALRFDAGDVYPAYSSLRPDPLGARALYESLERLPGVRVRRHLDPAPESLPEGRGTTLLLLGLRPEALRRVPEADALALERFVRDGGRLVLALHGGGPSWLENTDEERGRRERRRRELEEREREDAAGRTVALTERWGFRVASVPLGRDEDGVIVPVSATRATAAPAELPAELRWRAPRVLRPADDAWLTVYARDGDPVVLERRLGPGRIVLVTDAFPFSNEALRRERETAFLWWALGGGGRRVVFDETRLGVAQRGGVATLARRYGLHGVPVALLAVVALVIWRGACPLAPRRPDAPEERQPSGRESAEAFQNLLRRAVPARDLAAACVREWRHGVAAGRPDLAPRAAALEARLATDDGRDLRRLWHDLAAIAAGHEAAPKTTPANSAALSPVSHVR